MTEPKKAPETVDEYIALKPAELRQRLSDIRAAILAAAPDATELISYGMPGYKLNGKPLIYFACETRHVGVHPGPEAIAAMGDKLADYKRTKGGIQFPHAKPFPYELVAEIVAYKRGKGRGEG